MEKSKQNRLYQSFVFPDPMYVKKYDSHFKNFQKNMILNLIKTNTKIAIGLPNRVPKMFNQDSKIFYKNIFFHGIFNFIMWVLDNEL